MSIRLTFTLHELVQSIDDYADGILRERYGVDIGLFTILATMSEQTERMDVTSLARCLGFSKAAVSKRVPTLVSAGWIATESDPANARRVVLTLTPKAIDLVTEAGAELDGLLLDAFATLPHVDVPQLNETLMQIVHAIRAKNSPQ